MTIMIHFNVTAFCETVLILKNNVSFLINSYDADIGAILCCVLDSSVGNFLQMTVSSLYSDSLSKITKHCLA